MCTFSSSFGCNNLKRSGVKQQRKPFLFVILTVLSFWEAITFKTLKNCIKADNIVMYIDANLMKRKPPVLKLSQTTKIIFNFSTKYRFLFWKSSSTHYRYALEQNISKRGIFDND
jgi:hypothetical protein